MRTSRSALAVDRIARGRKVEKYKWGGGMSNIERRLRDLEDRAAINDLVVRYFLAVDSDDINEVGRTFSENARFWISGEVVASGRQEILDYLVAARRAMGLTVHTPDYVLQTRTDSGTVKGVVGAHLELVLGGKAVFGAVRYEDEYKQDGGVWMIQRRDMRTIHIAPWDQVGQAFSSDRPVRWPGADPHPSDYPRIK